MICLLPCFDMTLSLNFLFLIVFIFFQKKRKKKIKLIGLRLLDDTPTQHCSHTINGTHLCERPNNDYFLFACVFFSLYYFSGEKKNCLFHFWPFIFTVTSIVFNFIMNWLEWCNRLFFFSPFFSILPFVLFFLYLYTFLK